MDGTGRLGPVDGGGAWPQGRLLFGLFVAAPDLPRLVGLFGFNLPVAADVRRPYWHRFGWSPRIVGISAWCVVGLFTWSMVQDSLSYARTGGFLADVPEIEGLYAVESFVQGGLSDRQNEDAARWVRVGLNAPSLTTIQRASGVSVRMSMALDTLEGTVSFYDRGAPRPDEPQFTYTQPETGVLRLEGEFEGKSTTAVLRKSDDAFLLVERGFRWVNEFPFNR